MKTLVNMIVLAIALLTINISQAQCPGDLYDGREWTGEWNTNFGKLVLTQKGSRVTGTYSNLGKIDAYYDRFKRTLKGTFTNKGKKGSFEFKFECEKFTGKWGWGDKLDRGSWTGKRIVPKSKEYKLKVTLTNLYATQSGDGSGNPDDYSFGFTPELYDGKRYRTLTNKSYKSKAAFNKANAKGNTLFVFSPKNQLHLQGTLGNKAKMPGKNGTATINNSGIFTVEDSWIAKAKMTMTVDLMENTKNNLFNARSAPYWLINFKKEKVNIKAVLDYLTGKVSEKKFKQTSMNAGVIVLDLSDLGSGYVPMRLTKNKQGKKEVFGFVDGLKKADGRTYRALIKYKIELVN